MFGPAAAVAAVAAILSISKEDLVSSPVKDDEVEGWRLEELVLVIGLEGLCKPRFLLLDTENVLGV